MPPTAILCVTAHPDDESGGFGATLARYARAGLRVRVLCLTAGGAARNRGAAADPESLKALRRQELAAACHILGVEQEVWDYPDGGLARLDFEEVVGRLVSVIRRDCPSLVLTFGPEGSVTGHPDHAMAGVFATSAFHWAAHERYFPGAGKVWQARRLFYTTATEQPPQFAAVLLPPVDVIIDGRDFLELKIAAFKAHLTQAPLASRLEEFVRRLGGRECFHLAAGAGGLRRGEAADLFEGLAD